MNVTVPHCYKRGNCEIVSLNVKFDVINIFEITLEDPIIPLIIVNASKKNPI